MTPVREMGSATSIRKGCILSQSAIVVPVSDTPFQCRLLKMFSFLGELGGIPGVVLHLLWLRKYPKCQFLHSCFL